MQWQDTDRTQVGVDDATVRNYDKNLLETYQKTFVSAEDHQAIQFRSLDEMFFANSDAQAIFDQSWCRLFLIEHPIHSQRSSAAELARNIMMTGFQSSREHFHKLIDENHPPTLSLYRGQARFMQDDLSDPMFLAMSNKQKKKLSFKVAAEMIARNQAYSNLLELLLPNFVRLSIHAHSNSGPKFGIRLLPRDQVHAIDSIMGRHTLCPSYEFQVPTPWHNAIIKVEGDNMFYLGKAELAHEAVQHGDFEGGWVEDAIEGGHFALRPKFNICNNSSTAAESTSTVCMDYTENEAGMSKSGVVEVVMNDPPREVTKMRFSVRLYGKVYRVLELSRLLAKRVTGDRSGLPNSKRGVVASTR
jgi:pyoverdine/dityrosine biosynthesis protein Dit1